MGRLIAPDLLAWTADDMPCGWRTLILGAYVCWCAAGRAWSAAGVTRGKTGRTDFCARFVLGGQFFGARSTGGITMHRDGRRWRRTFPIAASALRAAGTSCPGRRLAVAVPGVSLPARERLSEAGDCLSGRAGMNCR
jgi:hypothetical protein